MFKEVSKAEFFAFMNPKNVQLHSERDETLWIAPNRAVLGKSVPGYVQVGQKRWFLVDGAAA